MLTDQQLRDLLAQADPADGPDPAFEARLLARLEAARHRSRSPGWRIERPLIPAIPGIDGRMWLALVVLAATLMLVGFLSAGSRPRRLLAVDPVASPTATLPDPRPVALASTTTLPGRPLGIATDANGSVWATAGSKVVRIDPRTARIDLTIDLHQPGAASIALGSDLWVATRDPGKLTRVDRLTGATRDSVAVDPPDAIAIDDRTPGRPAVVVVSGSTATISEVDTSTLAVRWRTSIAGRPVLLAAGEGRIWVAVRPATNPAGLELSVFDPTGTELGRVPLHEEADDPGAMVVARTERSKGELWMSDPSAGAVIAVDPITLSIRHVFGVGPVPVALAEQADGTFLSSYFATAGDRPIANGLVRVDPTSGVTGRYIVRDEPGGSSRGIIGLAGADRVWLAMDWNGDASVGSIDAASFR